VARATTIASGRRAAPNSDGGGSPWAGAATPASHRGRIAGDRVEVVIVADRDEAGRLVADAVGALVDCRPAPVLGLATGSTPLPVYRELARRVAAGDLSLASVRAFLLDEYVGLPPGHPEAYRAFIARELEAHVDFAAGAVRGPEADAADVPAACAAYEEAIRTAGGVDLQLLGIGTDGHIGFNEPGSSLASRTRIKTLTDQTRQDNARFFGSLDEVPRHVVTQGIGTILDARHLVLLAFGGVKATAVAHAVEGPVTAMVPASALQLHPHATVVVDEDAGSSLRLADYYRETWAHKPTWQGL
jgi:glucosamine-6-phosphate deaminase